MKKLDPELRRLVSRQRETPPSARADERVRISVEFRGELGDLEAVGFVKSSVVANPVEGYKIATGTIPVSRLEALANIDSVVSASAPVPMRPLLN